MSDHLIDRIHEELHDDHMARRERQNRRADEYPPDPPREKIDTWPRTVRCHRPGCDGTNEITYDDFIASSWKIEACSLECRRYLERLDAIDDEIEFERWELANLRR